MDPYEVLGVSPDDDEETIKKAYRELVKKYHPDKYVNNPLADLAGEKIKEINKAYDMITNKQTGSQGGTRGTSSSRNYNGGSYDVSFKSVRALISSNRLLEAQIMLNSLPRNAEWYYLTGIIAMRRGWYNNAVENIRKAVEMDPGNTEYKDALDAIKSRTAQYQRTTVDNSGCCTEGCCLGSILCLRPCCCYC